MREALGDQVDEEGLPLALIHFSHPAVTFESQAACLRRLGLLLPGEAELIPASACRPQKIAAESVA